MSMWVGGVSWTLVFGLYNAGAPAGVYLIGRLLEGASMPERLEVSWLVGAWLVCESANE